MRKFLKIGIASILLISFTLVSGGKETAPVFVKMEVKGVSSRHPY
jgi:hypothetical protein